MLKWLQRWREAGQQAHQLLGSVGIYRGSALGTHHAEKALEQAERSGDKDAQAAAHKTLALQRLGAGQLDDALRHAEAAVGLSQENPLGQIRAIPRLVLASVEVKRGNLDRARALAAEVLVLNAEEAPAEARAAPLWAWTTLKTKADAHGILMAVAYAAGLPDAALKHAEIVARCWDRLAPSQPGAGLAAKLVAMHPGAIQARLQLAQAQAAAGLRRKALGTLESLDASTTSSASRPMRLLLLTMRADLLRTCGDLETAARAGEEAVQLAEASVGSVLDRAGAHEVLGLIRAQRNDPQGATQALAAAVELYAAIGSGLHEAHARCSLADALALRQDLAGARRQYEQAIAPLRALSPGISLVQALTGLALILHLQGETAEALDVLEEAAGLPIESPSLRAQIGLMGAMMLKDGGAHAGAATLLRSARDLLADSDPAGTALVSHELAGSLWILGDRPAALDDVTRAIHAIGELRGLQSTSLGSQAWTIDLARVFRQALQFAAEAGDERLGLTVLETARGTVIAGLLRARGSEGIGSGVDTLLRKVDALRARLAQGNDTEKGPTLGLSGLLGRRAGDVPAVDLQQRLDDAVHLLEEATGDFAQRYAPNPLAPDSAWALVPKDTCGVAYHIDQDRNDSGSSVLLTRVWWTPSSEAEPCGIDQLRIKPDDWEEITAPFSNGEPLVIGASVPTLARHLAELGTWLVPDGIRTFLRSEHRPEAPPHAVFVPTRELWFCPFAALPIDGRPLAEIAAISLTPSLLSLPPHDSPADGASPTGEALVFLDPNSEAMTRYLEQELPSIYQAIHRAMSATDLRDQLHSSAGRDMAMIVAHGDSQPGLAHALHLSDGSPLLSAAHLIGARLPRSLTLGACSSAGRGRESALDEPIGLAVIALAAGARTVAATLWPVPNTTQTARLYLEFHRGLDRGLRPAEAMRRAQTSIWLTDPTAPLDTWAGHVVIGRGF